MLGALQVSAPEQHLLAPGDDLPLPDGAKESLVAAMSALTISSASGDPDDPRLGAPVFYKRLG